MKTFAGHKSNEVVQKQCVAAGISFDDTAYRTHGSDYVKVEGGGACVLYNTFNGRFHGKTDTGVEFTSDSAEHDGEPWMQALLSFFYEEKK